MHTLADFFRFLSKNVEINFDSKENTTLTQRQYREVPRWEIFMEHELRLGLDLGRLAVLKKRVWADYEQLLRVFFSCFQGQKKFLKFFKNIVASALKSYIKRSEIFFF